MSFHHRKLLTDSLEDSISILCQSYCDLPENLDGSCPISCISHCYPICKHPLFYDPPPPPPPSYVADHPGRSYRFSVFLTISLAALAAAFLVFFCYTVYKFYTGWYRSRRQQPPAQPQEEEARLDFLDEDHGPVVDHPIWYIRTVGLQPSVISAITICKYKRGDGLVEGTDCAVCLNEFQEDETLRLLPKCNHAFHIPCIDTWLQSHTNCPMCRAGIVINTANPHSPEQSSYSSGRVEESQLQVSENDREPGRNREDEELQGVTIEVENEDELRARTVLKRDGEDVAGNSYARQGDGIQPLRRSVSMDSLSASMVSSAISNAFSVNSDRSSGKQALQTNQASKGIALKRVDADQNLLKSAGSSSNERALQKGSSSSSSSMVLRSLSCSAKVFLSRYSRSSRSSVPLPRSF